MKINETGPLSSWSGSIACCLSLGFVPRSSAWHGGDGGKVAERWRGFVPLLGGVRAACRGWGPPVAAGALRGGWGQQGPGGGCTPAFCPVFLVPFSQPLCQQEAVLFLLFFFFFFPPEENSIVLFLVVTARLLAATLLCSLLRLKAAGGSLGVGVAEGRGVHAGGGCVEAVPMKRFWLQLCVEILGRARHGRAWAVPRGRTPAVRSASSRQDE